MIAVLADDLTGAAEIAGLGLRHGLAAEILEREEPVPRAPLVVYNSDSRHCPPGEARRRVARILKRLRRRRPDWWYKKVDSVLRGNVLAEIEAALGAWGLKRCLLVSANPNAGRTVRRGVYYVHGTPLHRTDFRNDPHHPRRSAKVIELLGRSPSASLCVIRAGTTALRDGINIGDATKFEHVLRWADLADERTLTAGGADFFRALLLKLGHAIVPTSSRSMEKGGFAVGGRRKGRSAASRMLFVTGSLAESSLRFLGACRSKGWPVMLMPGEMLASGRGARSSEAAWAQTILNALNEHPTVVAGIGAPRLPGRQMPLRLGRMLTGAVRRVLSETRPDVVCVEGGETAALLIRRMGWTRFTVEAEFATGVTALRPRACRDLLLVVKPGSYLWPQAITRDLK